MSDDERDERYAYSSTTGNWYRVTEWDNLGDGKIRAKSKERVAHEDVPQESINGVVESLLSGRDHAE